MEWKVQEKNPHHQQRTQPAQHQPGTATIPAPTTGGRRRNIIWHKYQSRSSFTTCQCHNVGSVSRRKQQQQSQRAGLQCQRLSFTKRRISCCCGDDDKPRPSPITSRNHHQQQQQQQHPTGFTSTTTSHQFFEEKKIEKHTSTSLMKTPLSSFILISSSVHLAKRYGRELKKKEDWESFDRRSRFTAVP